MLARALASLVVWLLPRGASTALAGELRRLADFARDPVDVSRRELEEAEHDVARLAGWLALREQSGRDDDRSEALREAFSRALAREALARSLYLRACDKAQS